jgi:hypothetical protein
VQPLVPGYTITGELSSSASGSRWSAVRSHDERRLVVKIVGVSDMAQALVQAAGVMDVVERINNEHLVRQRDVIALADNTLALVLDEVAGERLVDVLGSRSRLTPGETVTTVAPLFGALADLHSVGVVHGDLTPEQVLFSADGKPLICDLGVARLRGRQTGPVDRASRFGAPELVGDAAPSTASDVYAMAAIGWFCLTGAPPPPGAPRKIVTGVTPETPPRLVQVLASCLSADPTARPSAGDVAASVFDAASAEPVRLGSVSDPASDITRRVRAAAVSAPTVTPPLTMKPRPPAFVIGVVALLVAAVLGGGATWLLRRPPVAVQPVAVRSAQPLRPAATAVASSADPNPTARSIADVVTAPDSPRTATVGLLQALVDARALAYAARNPALLDLVYAPGATKAAVDRSNIATSLRSGATYLGLSFVVKDVVFLDGTPNTARIRATIVTPAYETGQPDGRKVPHPQEIVGPSVFTVNLVPDGWRILRLTTP